MRIKFLLPLMLLFGYCAGSDGFAQELRPPTKLEVKDAPNDNGEVLLLTWELSPDDKGEPNRVTGYRLERKIEPSDEDGFVVLEPLAAGTTSFDDEELDSEKSYIYRLTALGEDDATSQAVTSAAISPVVSYFNWSKMYLGLLMLAACLAIVFFILWARSGRDLKIRKVAGLEAVEEAVGRATEMGRDVLFIPGIQDINDIQTVAGLIVLNRVAELTAEYDASLDVPTTRSLVMTTARETVEEAYTKAGRPDLYNPESIYYLTDEQFGFVAGVTGKMVREKPAACFYMGAFYAESLIFAETANNVGAIQIAGTAMPSQLPFFVAACDYVLIGEEFFAASAYLSGEPQQLGSLKGQDLGKLMAGILILVGSILMTIVALQEAKILPERGGRFERVVNFVMETLLGS